jgi:hypothetical protein
MTMAALVKLSNMEINYIAKELKAAGVPRGFNKNRFCDLWHEVEPILEKLQPIVAVIPVYGSMISWGIGIVLSIGNAIAKAYC